MKKDWKQDELGIYHDKDGNEIGELDDEFKGKWLAWPKDASILESLGPFDSFEEAEEALKKLNKDKVN